MNHALWYVHSEAVAKRKIYVVKQRKHIRISTCFQRYVSHYFKQVCSNHTVSINDSILFEIEFRHLFCTGC